LVVITVERYDGDDGTSLVPLYRLSPALRSLQLAFASLPDSQVIGLICSLPLLEDLALVCIGHGNRDDGWNAPSTSPRLTGSLELRMVEGIQPIAHRLLNLPNGLHFTKIVVTWFFVGDVPLTMDLVSRCSDTLQFLDVVNEPSGEFPLSLYPIYNLPLHADASGTTGLDLSKTTKLRDVVFRCGMANIEWINKTLQTTEPKNLQHLSLALPRALDIRDTVWETVHQEWLDLDCLLVQFWTSHSLRPKVMCEPGKGGKDYVARFLPELTSRGIVDLVECSG
jgi:hypothetical protein